MLPIWRLALDYTRIALADGVTTRLFDSGGDGIPIILIHGLAASIEIWAKVIPDLSAKHRVIAFDLPGFGEADRPDAAYDAPFFVRQLQALMDSLKIDKAHLVGSSLGASLIVRFAANNLGRIATATLAAPGGFAPYVHPFLRLPTLPVAGYALAMPSYPVNWMAVRLAMANSANATKELIKMVDRYSKMRGSQRAFYRTLNSVIGPMGVKPDASFHADAAAMAVPTTLLWGEQDRLFPVAQAEIAQRVLPNARLARLPNCGHYPQWEAPDQTVKAVVATISG
jgi:pimeloyl-ACP methyl ester carboxylesterase